MSPAVEAIVAEQKKKQQQFYMEKGVMLEPFVHQVGGHSCVLRFGDETICKPLYPREHQFYKSLPAAMRKFTPQYRGVVSVSFEEDEEGNHYLIAYPLCSDPPTDVGSKDSADGRSCQKEKSGHKLLDDMELEWLQQAEVLHYRQEHGHSNAAPQLKHNPWSLKCHQEHLRRMKENAKHRNQYKFILLENLTWRHSVPCVLDLKMGTQQHGDDCSEEKKATKIRKCQQSTSSSIGMRLSGMQVYHPDTGQLIFMTKYHGQKLTIAGFKESLFQFFHSGRRLRHELLSPVLSRLRELQAALEACESYRFYSSSLLIIYDGAPHRKHKRQNTEDSLSEDDEEGDEEEEEEAEAVPKMDQEGDEEERDKEEEGQATSTLGFPHSSSTPSDGGGNGGCSGSSSISQIWQSRSDSLSPSVDVRMIDFAHTTCRHYGEDSVVYEGKDSGYVFGLQNLITFISELENHSTD